MAYQHTALQLDVAHAAQTLIARLGDAMTNFGNAMMTHSAGYARLQQVEALKAKTDAELAAMKIKREDIVQHVFRDLYYI
ncbi:hypothetical protein [Sulfitobacter sabulilitoris]|uniref:DUF1127 domain-containing protein n=1 Tax=Sulfitobacter sabulilitoris TaxID=2562655 RepID=A0A5S3PGN8_9RHOB|nr:hypothetical protein [Sulfitobacter sabulilitoris]TMM50802.1 hypothetical protein FDT80_16220 [Sulfitobacter sabulilitoris]